MKIARISIVCGLLISILVTGTANTTMDAKPAQTGDMKPLGTKPMISLSLIPLEQVSTVSVTQQPEVQQSTPTPPERLATGCEATSKYTDWNTVIAYAVCMSESSGNSSSNNTNYNGSSDRGLMQINSIHADMVNGDLDSLYDPSVNIEIAHKIWSGSRGWNSWNGYTSGRYLKYL